MKKTINNYINQILELFKNTTYYSEIDAQVNEIIKDFQYYISTKTPRKKDECFEIFENIIYSFNFVPQVYFLSLLINISSNKKYYKKLYQITLEDNTLSINTSYFLLYQLSAINFKNISISDDLTYHLNIRLYKKVYENYKNKLTNILTYIPKEKRKENLIFIFTSQFLQLNHAPTKSVIDRAYNLKKLGKDVIIINTTELLSQENKIPFFNASIPTIIKEYEQLNSFDYLDERIPYFQCSNMPSLEGIINIISIVEEYKPSMAFSLGSFNLTADICSNLIPIATISTVFSTFPTTFSQFLITGKQITKNDIERLSPYGFNKDNLISHLFTSSFKPQTKKFTKNDFNIPEDKFILAIIGTRLQDEVKEEFLNLLLKDSSLNLHILFVGTFYNYKNLIESNKLLNENSTFIGFQNDILAILELCDLYINPKRNGGGMSSIEALYKNVPVLTYKYGDVYINVGDDFAINNDQELIKSIKLYKENINYYKNQILLGQEKVKKLTNTKESLKSLLKKIEMHSLYN